MADLTLAGSVTRSLLGLGDLNINDYTSYFLSAQMDFGEKRYQRNAQGSPYMRGEVTVNRTEKQRIRNIGVEVLGTSHANLESNLQALLDAFDQDSYNLTLTINGTTRTYVCEAADYSLPGWVSGRIVGRVVLVQFSVPTRPIPVAGSF